MTSFGATSSSRRLRPIVRLLLAALVVCMFRPALALDWQLGLGMANFAEDEGSSATLDVGQGHWQIGLSYSQAYTSSRNEPVWRGYEIAMVGLGYRNQMENLTTYVRGGVLWLMDTEQIFAKDSNPGRFLLIGVEAPLLRTPSNGVLKVAMEGGSMGKGAELRTGEEVAHGFMSQVLLKWAF
ncbi:hypothetical protein ACLBKS_12365 [Hylemonella sp. W303a]|uniref:hypothetical protein n=1 Tax=Hylemonella sp. W303a TaxID=3389873 RepID=UPI00396AF7A3